jgi:hypothetical protein
MVARRCRSCRISAPGASITVARPRAAATDWHLCGRCWALLTVGLQHQLDVPDPDLHGLTLQAVDVRAAIDAGLREVTLNAPQGPSTRDELLEQGEQLILDLQAVVLEVQASARFGIPPSAWRDLRQRTAQLHGHVRELRLRYLDGRVET